MWTGRFALTAALSFRTSGVARRVWLVAGSAHLILRWSEDEREVRTAARATTGQHRPARRQCLDALPALQREDGAHMVLQGWIGTRQAGHGEWRTGTVARREDGNW